MHAFLIENKEPNFESLGNFSDSKRLFFEVEKISQVKDLLSFLRFPPKTNTLLVLTGVDNSSIEAQNSLLKLLEEPSSQIRFLICVGNKESVLPTILSRVQVISEINRVEPTTQSFSNRVSKLDVDILNLKDRESAVLFLESTIKDENEPSVIKDLALNSLFCLKRNTNVALTMLNFLVHVNSLAT